ncbi:MAG: hypothetical protein V1798_02910 [Pseudomonadota bacterium]
MRTTLCAVALVLAGSAAQAATNYNVLNGDWNGTITTNLKDTAGGGMPTEGATGTPVVITLKPSGAGVSGTSDVAGSKESWQIQKEEYTWNDGTVTVSTKSIAYKDVPEWVRKQATLNPADTFFAFKYSKCTVNATKANCVVGKDVPAGIDKSGVWLFRVERNKLQSAVYYNYPNGGKRILEQNLTKK